VLALQRSAGNVAVARAIGQAQLQRDDVQVGVTDVRLSPGTTSVPVEATTSPRAPPVPANATGVTWKAKKGSVEPSGTTVGADGPAELPGSHPGGAIQSEAAAPDGSTAWAGMRFGETPPDTTSTSGSAAASQSEYKAQFKHTLAGASGAGSGVEGANIN